MNNQLASWEMPASQLKEPNRQSRCGRWTLRNGTQSFTPLWLCRRPEAVSDWEPGAHLGGLA